MQGAQVSSLSPEHTYALYSPSPILTTAPTSGIVFFLLCYGLTSDRACHDCQIGRYHCKALSCIQLAVLRQLLRNTHTKLDGRRISGRVDALLWTRKEIPGAKFESRCYSVLRHLCDDIRFETRNNMNGLCI